MKQTPNSCVIIFRFKIKDYNLFFYKKHFKECFHLVFWGYIRCQYKFTGALFFCLFLKNKNQLGMI